MKKRRVAITGLGLINPYGEGDVEDFFSRIMRGESAVRYHTLSNSPRPLTLPLVACSHFNPIAALGPPLANAMDRFSHFAVASALSAWQDSGLAKHSNRDDYGVNWGTGSGGSLTIERGYQTLYFENKERVSPLSVVLAMNNSAASHIAMQLGLGGLVSPVPWRVLLRLWLLVKRFGEFAKVRPTSCWWEAPKRPYPTVSFGLGKQCGFYRKEMRQRLIVPAAHFPRTAPGSPLQKVAPLW